MANVKKATKAEMLLAAGKLGCEVSYVSEYAAKRERANATEYWHEYCKGGEEAAPYFAAENGWCCEPGWWWQQETHEEQQHGPFATQLECVQHCLTWQHVLVNGQLGGHLPYDKVWAPGFTHIVQR